MNRTSPHVDPSRHARQALLLVVALAALGAGTAAVLLLHSPRKTPSSQTSQAARVHQVQTAKRICFVGPLSQGPAAAASLAATAYQAVRLAAQALGDNAVLFDAPRFPTIDKPSPGDASPRAVAEAMDLINAAVVERCAIIVTANSEFNNAAAKVAATRSPVRFLLVGGDRGLNVTTVSSVADTGQVASVVRAMASHLGPAGDASAPPSPASPHGGDSLTSGQGSSSAKS